MSAIAKVPANYRGSAVGLFAHGLDPVENYSPKANDRAEPRYAKSMRSTPLVRPFGLDLGRHVFLEFDRESMPANLPDRSDSPVNPHGKDGFGAIGTLVCSRLTGAQRRDWLQPCRKQTYPRRSRNPCFGTSIASIPGRAPEERLVQRASHSRLMGHGG
jgi:hypothetical protein